MRTVLSTIPELENSPDKARAVLPNFTFDQMKAMFRADLLRPTHRFLVAVDADGRLVGHSMNSRKQTPEGETFGYFFSRFVLPEHLNSGVAGGAGRSNGSASRAAAGTGDAGWRLRGAVW